MFYGKVCKWLKRTDCKSVTLWFRKFKSFPSHQHGVILKWLRELFAKQSGLFLVAKVRFLLTPPDVKGYIAFTINPHCPVVAYMGHKMQNGVMEAHEFHRLEI